MLHTVIITSFFLYLGAATSFLFELILPGKRYFGLARLVFGLAFVLQTVGLVLFLMEENMRLLESGADYFFWLSWALALTYLLFIDRRRYPAIGALLAPAAALFMVSSSYLVHSGPERRYLEADPVLIGVHIMPALIAELCLVLAFIVSILFLIQERRLKAKRSNLQIFGPSLSMLALFNWRCVLIGFVTMSCAVVSGCLWSLGLGEMLLGSDLTRWLALFAWVALAVIAHFRLTLRWSAHRVSKATVVVAALYFVCSFLVIFITGAGVHELNGY